jgi:hypothetical protein
VKADAVIRIHGPWLHRFLRPLWWVNDIPMDVVVDGHIVGQVWGYQTNVFPVTAGNHSVRLRRGWFPGVMRSQAVEVTAGPNEVVDLASPALPLVLSGIPALRLATSRDISRAAANRGTAPTPRNLAEPRN